jgi:hypothetical protein
MSEEENETAASDGTEDNVIPLSRQVRRAQEREAAKLAEKTDAALADAERATALASQRMMSLMKTRHMLFALVRATGRVRIHRDDLKRVTDRDKLDVKVQENGDLVVTFEEG